MSGYATYDPLPGAAPWHAEIRALTTGDIPRIAEIFAERESTTPARAAETVSRWLSEPNRVVIVAEHLGRVQGYGKAKWLAPSAAGGDAPTGWYLTGVVVAPAARRHGLGTKLTQARIDMLAERTSRIWYFSNPRNGASIALHRRFGFVEQTRDFSIPGLHFAGGVGVLFRLDLGDVA